MIRRFIKVTPFEVRSNGKVVERERLLKLERIHSVTPNCEFDDAITLWDGEFSKICHLEMTIDELIEVMKKPIEIEI